jgi:phosphoribosyl 1,2-cyclic phosphate phosphodiesterase
MKDRFLFLGTAASAGIPMIACRCNVCLSSSPYNSRLRSSGLLKIDGKVFLIDSGPDLRSQALKYKIDRLDGVLLTHTHFDHIAGIDELRVYYLSSRKKMPCLLSLDSLSDLRKRYDYLFHTGDTVTLSAQLEFTTMDQDHGELDFLGVKFKYISYFQGGMRVNGFRFRNFAYVSDIRDYDPSIFTHLKGVQKLVLSAPRHEPSPLHLSLEEAVEFAKKVGAQETWLTHVSHEIDHEETNRKLPPSIQFGFDGLEMEIE